MIKYLQIRHWNYWWDVYGFTGLPIIEVELSITEDKDGEQLFFGLEFYTLPVLEDFLKSGEFIEKDNEEFPYFEEKALELRRGIRNYFVGGLYYKDYWPNLIRCNQYQKEKNGIFSVKSPERTPYYAVLFIREERQLLPDLLIEWMEKLSYSLFGENFVYKIADVPTYEIAGEEFRSSPEYINYS